MVGGWLVGACLSFGPSEMRSKYSICAVARRSAAASRDGLAGPCAAVVATCGAGDSPSGRTVAAPLSPSSEIQWVYGCRIRRAFRNCVLPPVVDCPMLFGLHPDFPSTCFSERCRRPTVVRITPHAGPCVRPQVVALSRSFQGFASFARLLGDQNGETRELLRELNIIEVPTFIFFRWVRCRMQRRKSWKGSL